MRCSINVRRAQREKETAVRSDSLKRAMDTLKKECAFCPENLERMTPCFPKEVIPERRLKDSSAVLFPNLYPFSEYHTVAIFSGHHDLGLNEFSPILVRNNLRLCIEYLKRIRHVNKEIRYWSISWNHLPPAGGSIIHPYL